MAMNESEIEDAIWNLIHELDDPEREGLEETPLRVMKFYREWITLGEPNFACTAFDAEGMDEMIVQKHIPFYSLCEHHLLPFFGEATVAYIPKGKIIGLSKLARVVQWYARRLQNQERLTQNISTFLNKELEPLGVGVILQARHMCMEMRGVKASGTHTITSSLKGAMKDDFEAKKEFLAFFRSK